MPGWSDYRKRVQVLSTDVTKLLQTGPNRFGAILGDGWYCGYLLWKKDRNFYGKHPQLLARLEIELVSGRRISIVTDRTWNSVTVPFFPPTSTTGKITMHGKRSPAGVIRRHGLPAGAG